MNNKKIIKIKRNSKVYFELAQNMLEEKRYESAIYYISQSLNLKETADGLCLMGDAYCAIDLYDEALNYYLRALNYNPNNFDFLDKLGQTLVNLEQEDIALYYFTPNMTIKKFNSIMQDGILLDLFEPPQIRIVERSDDATVGVAVKLIESGDWAYAKEILLTIRPDSKHYAKACNLLAINAIESGEFDEALKYVNTALEKYDIIFTRCNQLYIYNKLNEKEKEREILDIIEKAKLSIDERKSVAMAYLRVNMPDNATKHLSIVLQHEPYDKTCLVSNALCKYALNERDSARALMLKANHIFPFDVEISEFLRSINAGEELGLSPYLGEEIGKSWILDIENKLDLVKDSEDGLINDSDFVKKINWLFQSDYLAKQNKVSLVLCSKVQWKKFFMDLLLDNYCSILQKKSILFSLLYNLKIQSLAIVIEGMYAKLKVSYPDDMDEMFFSSFCLAFSSFAFCDSCFENRLYKASLKLLKKYNSGDFDKTKIVTKEGLASLIFYYTKHEKITKASQCAHIFGCSEREINEYIDAFELNKKKGGKK